tara:strand:+ start:904 stop:1524 length:621 start_codon:yes stop_codon:yes gene_type:complete
MEQYNQEAVEAFANTGKPIPGQSLTSNPDEKRPFESPPEFSQFKEALDYTVAELLEPEVYRSLVLALGDGMTITDMTLQICYVGFREGKWNPDLMMMLIEPLMYVLMSLCEKAGIEYRIDDDDDDDESVESILEQKAKNISEATQAKMEQSSSIPQGAVPSDVMQRIQQTEAPEGLLARPQEASQEELVEEPSADIAEDSLLSRGQ